MGKWLHPDVAGVRSLVIDIQDRQHLLYSSHFKELETLTVVYGRGGLGEDNDVEKVREIKEFLNSAWCVKFRQQSEPPTLQPIPRKSFRSLIVFERPKRSLEIQEGKSDWSFL